MQTAPTDLEAAILMRIAQGTQPLRSVVGQLRVLRRELTGAGSFTYFEPGQPVSIPDGLVGLDALVSVPGVTHGMGAALSIMAGQPTCLEIFTYGTCSWSGKFEGFVIESAT